MSDYCEHQWQDEKEIEHLNTEIERLRTDLETAERALDAQTDFRKEIERLKNHVKYLNELRKKDEVEITRLRNERYGPR
jgi:predicted  nucleic acid-binding Zn-ribbon protein